MYCENCGQNYANVKYTQIINGNKNEMFLCEKCSKELGVQNFNLPMDFSTFLSDFMADFEERNLFQENMGLKELRCKRCNYTFEDFINTGKFGCYECYDTFEDKIDPFLKSIQGSNRHIGRIGEINKENIKINEKGEESEKDTIKETMKLGQINELNRQLKLAIKEEKYEEAASLRDKIKELEGEK